jgi:hypothetical protein
MPPANTVSTVDHDPPAVQVPVLEEPGLRGLVPPGAHRQGSHQRELLTQVGQLLEGVAQTLEVLAPDEEPGAVQIVEDL